MTDSALPEYTPTSWANHPSAVLTGSHPLVKNRKVVMAWVKQQWGLDVSERSLPVLIQKLAAHVDADEFQTVIPWIIFERGWSAQSLPTEKKQALPNWFWKAILQYLTSLNHFEALTYVDAETWMTYMESDEAKQNLAHVNFYRKQRIDTIGLMPDEVFLSIYGQ